MKERLARVLLDQSPFCRTRRKPGVVTQFTDGSSVPYIIGELVANGAHSIVLPRNGGIDTFRGVLPVALRQRLSTVTSPQRFNAFVVRLTTSLMEEQGGSVGKVLDDVILSFHFPLNHNKRIGDATTSLSSQLPTFFLGLKSQAQVSLQLSKVQDNVDVLRDFTSSKETRATLDVLAGILSGYEASELVLPQLRASNEDYIDRLHQLVQTDEYIALSQAYAELGVVGRGVLIGKEIQTLAERLCNRRWARRFLRLGHYTTERFVKMKAPFAGDIPAFSDLVKEKYLPPLVDMSSALLRARARWVKARPPAVLHPSEHADQVEGEDDWGTSDQQPDRLVKRWRANGEASRE